MKQIIKRVLEEISTSQVNLTSAAARKTVSSLISAALKAQGYNNKNNVNSYLTADLSEEEQKARETWVCSICGKNTYDVDYEYIGSCTNHLGCELEVEMKSDKRVTNDRRSGDRREKNYSQKKHEDKVFGHDQGGSYEKKVWPGLDAIKKQAYLEMTSDGLPEGGDAQAVLESHKLADEIVDNQEGKWIYESPDGGKTVFRRPFSDYDPKNKEEINWETKEPTGRKFNEYPFKENVNVQIDGC
jgi:hypothetical protein